MPNFAERESKPPRVLLVEDDPDLARFLERELLATGFEVIGPIAEGREACVVGLREQADAATIDIHLADEVNGIEVARVLFANTNTGIVFISSYDDPDVIAAAGWVACCSFLSKPFSTRQLVAELRATLARQTWITGRSSHPIEEEDDDEDLACPMTNDAIDMAIQIQNHALLLSARDGFGLPESLAQVAADLAQGYTRAEISVRRRLTSCSIDTYIKRIYEKTNQHGRRALALALICHARNRGIARVEVFHQSLDRGFAPPEP